MTEQLKAPFPWFGGKSRIAKEVWEGLGDVDNYIEPFAGSLAVLLSRPHEPKAETVNDLDRYVANFWRAMTADPESVAYYADWPVNETDLFARHLWLVNEGRDALAAGLENDPEWFDPRIAGWWVWGLCSWIGSGWCSGKGPHKKDATQGRGVNRKRPHLGNQGSGVNRKLPHLGNEGAIYDYMKALGERLRRVRVCCGDWRRVCTTGAMSYGETVGVFLDPPYGEEAKRTKDVYSQDSLSVAKDVQQWCLENANDPRIRIVLAGYEDEHKEALKDWRCVSWIGNKSYGSSAGGGINSENRGKERLWFSPSCLDPEEQNQDHPLFEGIHAARLTD